MSQKQTPPNADDPTTGEDAMADLFQLAGRRAPIPRSDAKRVKAMAFEQWQQTVRHERRRRHLFQAGGLLAAAAMLAVVVGLWVLRGASSGVVEMQATLESATGPVWLVDPESGEPISQLESGAELAAGATVETRSGAEKPVRALFRLAQGATLRLDTESRFGLADDGRLRLDHGAVYIDTGRQEKGASEPSPTCCEVFTPFGSVRDIGTQFEVRSSRKNPLRARVRQGAILYSSTPTFGGAEHRAEAGTELSVDRNGAVAAREITAEEDPWSWIRTILPTFDTEGRSLHELLSWAAEEGGWQLTYSTEAARREAEGLVIHGSIDGLGLEEATSIAFLGSGSDLRYEIADGALTVSLEDEAR